MIHLSEAASRQGELWGYGFRDWVEFQEPAMRALWDTVLDAAGVQAGVRFLDAGCGAGGALVAAAQRGATVFGVDASVNMLTVARDRLPASDMRVGDLENLPFPNRGFDAASSINSLQFAGNTRVAVHELGRVVRSGGRVAIAVHGHPARSDLNRVTGAIFALFEQPPSGGPFALSDRAVLESLIAATADLRLDGIESVTHPSHYPSLEAAVRGMMSAGGSRRAVELFGDERVRGVTRDALARFEHTDGSVRLLNEYLIAIATVAG